MSDIKILLIDNDPVLAERFKQKLSIPGVVVEVSQDGVSGLQSARDIAPNVVVINSMLPRCNGFIICRLLKYDQQYKQLPILIMGTLENEKDTAKEVGANSFVVKASGSDEIVQEAARLAGL